MASVEVRRLRVFEEEESLSLLRGCGWLILAILLFSVVIVLMSGNNTDVNSSQDPKSIAMQNTKLDYEWSKGGFGSVMLGSFTVTNKSDYQFKDFTVRCVHSAASGTVIDSNTHTVYDLVKAHSTKKFKEVNMGFIHSQATSSACKIIDLVVLQ